MIKAWHDWRFTPIGYYRQHLLQAVILARTTAKPSSFGAGA
jgi:hypothetical protein